jgi:ferritin
MSVKLRKLEGVAVDAITSRIANELSARYFYESASAWCRANGYDNAAQYFTNEATDENSHYMKWVNFLSDWNETVIFPKIDTPPAFTGLDDILNNAYEMEATLLDLYGDDAETIFPVCKTTFGIIQEYIAIQNASVIEYASLINKLSNYGDDIALFENEVFEN